MLINKESVEMFVYLKIGIWRGPTEINNTPHLHSMEQTQSVPTLHTNTSDASIRHPSVKIAKFHFQGLAKHFH